MKTKKLYLSNLAWKNKDLFPVLKIIKKNGFDGIDCAPLQFSNKWDEIEKKAKKYSSLLKDNKLVVNSIQGVFYQTKLNVFRDKKNNFKKIYKHILLIVKLCKIFKCKKIIIGSAEFRDIRNLNIKEADRIFVNFLKKILPILIKNKIYFCIEPIPKQYKERYIYNFEKLFILIKKIKSKWIKINFDTSLFHFNKLNLKLLNSNISLIKNIQISEKNFNFFKNPSKKNILFCKELNKIDKFENISLEIIAKKTDLINLNISLNKLRNLIN